MFNKTILSFLDFINESENPDMIFPWTDEIESLKNQILEKSESLESTFNYDKHRSKGFEFNIKSRNFPDTENLSKIYELSNDEIWRLWDEFPSESLTIYGEDIVENSEFFDDWFTEGRSGGWLILKYQSPLINDPGEVVRDAVSYLNDMLDEIDNDEYKQWREFNKIAGKGVNILKRLKMNPGNFENINNAENEARSVIESLKEDLQKLEKLENNLKSVGDSITDFWKNSEVNFEEYIKSDLENRY